MYVDKMSFFWENGIAVERGLSYVTGKITFNT